MFTFILSILLAWAIVCPRELRAASVDDVIKKTAGLSAAQRKTFREEGAKKGGEMLYSTSLSLPD